MSRDLTPEIRAVLSASDKLHRAATRAKQHDVTVLALLVCGACVCVRDGSADMEAVRRFVLEMATWTTNKEMGA